ncbi:MAG TPA: hypothetical protein VKY90_06920 [Candidatus Dormibacteraeota bacterium]|nr:hypothetical protein [Candidatus Dormibacteraeota bacterium]
MPVPAWLEGDDRGVNLRPRMAPRAREEGICRFSVLLDGNLFKFTEVNCSV